MLWTRGVVSSEAQHETAPKVGRSRIDSWRRAFVKPRVSTVDGRCGRKLPVLDVEPTIGNDVTVSGIATTVLVERLSRG
jgi:hypothetical protein